MALSLYNKIDDAVSHAVYELLHASGFDTTPHQHTAKLFWIRSPTPLLIAIALYASIVAVGVWRLKNAARQGRKRPDDPAWLKLAVQLHNAFLVCLSIYMSGGALYFAVKNRSLFGHKVDPRERGLGLLLYTFYVSKVYVLAKGKLEQVTVLHVYHHISVSLIWYSVFISSAVHVVIYSYYFLATLITDAKQRRKWLWWARHLTQFQMLQFGTLLVQSLCCWRFTAYPKALSFILFYYMLSLLALFSHFYVTKYVAGRGSRSLKSRDRSIKSSAKDGVELNGNASLAKEQ